MSAMRFRRVFTTLALLAPLALGVGGHADAKSKKVAKGKKPTPAATPAKKAAVAISPEHKKALSDLMAGFTFGMSKDEVVAAVGKQIDAAFAERISSTTDVYQQDRLRKEKKGELARFADTYLEFDGKISGWDTSIVETEFAHKTGEAMIVRWENQDGKNQRRFFFFANGKLYKMFITLDASLLPADKRNFETFQAVMFGRFGEGEVEPGRIVWRTDGFTASANDRLKDYAALALVIWDPAVAKSLEPLRAANAPKAKGPNALTKAVLATPDDKPDINANRNAIDSVLKQ